MSQGIKRRRSTRLSSSGYYNKRAKPIQAPTNFFSLEELQEMADYVKDRAALRPDVGVICGSGLGTLSDLVTDPTEIPYEEVPHMPVSTVEGHEGKFVIGRLGDKNVICMKGRLHHYEGYHSQQVTVPVRLMGLLGVQYLVVTNAAGGINEKFKAGDIMLIKDHINFLGLSGINPLIGPNLTTFGAGERFPDMVDCYDKELRKSAIGLAPKHGVTLQEGVYTLIGGPSFETPAEIRFLSIIGADAVGMSTAPEVIVARHCGMRVVAFSLITNMCVHPDSVNVQATSHSDVLQMGSQASGKLAGLITELINSLVVSEDTRMCVQPESEEYHDTMETSNTVASKTKKTPVSATPADDKSAADS